MPNGMTAYEWGRWATADDAYGYVHDRYGWYSYVLNQLLGGACDDLVRDVIRHEFRRGWEDGSRRVA